MGQPVLRYDLNVDLRAGVLCDVGILRIALNGVLYSRRSGRRNGSCCGVVWGEGGNGAVR